MQLAQYLVIYLAAFLLGSIPFGILMAHAFTDVKDLQSRGSGNIGATNVSRVAGFWPAGFLTFVFDFLKGVVPVFVVSLPAFQNWYLGLFQSSWGNRRGHDLVNRIHHGFGTLLFSLGEI